MFMLLSYSTKAVIKIRKDSCTMQLKQIVSDNDQIVCNLQFIL